MPTHTSKIQVQTGAVATTMMTTVATVSKTPTKKLATECVEIVETAVVEDLEEIEEVVASSSVRSVLNSSTEIDLKLVHPRTLLSSNLLRCSTNRSQRLVRLTDNSPSSSLFSSLICQLTTLSRT